MSNRSHLLVRIPHHRRPWIGSEEVHICVRWGRVKGSDESVRFRKKSTTDYQAAKNCGDAAAAARIVKMCVDRASGTIDLIVDCLTPHITANKDIIFVCPHPSFDDEDGSTEDIPADKMPRNMLPIVYANYLAESVAGSVDSKIIERERIGRTKLTALERFLWQPSGLNLTLGAPA